MLAILASSWSFARFEPLGTESPSALVSKMISFVNFLAIPITLDARLQGKRVLEAGGRYVCLGTYGANLDWLMVGKRCSSSLRMVV